MPDCRLDRAARIAFIIAFLCAASSLRGQRPTAQATSDSAPVSLWQSLFDGHHYFDLRDSLTAWRGAASPATRYFRGLTARAFNRPDEAVALLSPLVDGRSTGLTASQRVAAAKALAESYLSFYRYREAADAYRVATRSARGLSDPTARTTMQSMVDITGALTNALPQRITWRRVAKLDTLGNAGQRGRVAARLNGAPVDQPLLVDVGADFTILDSTTAATHRVPLLADSVSAISMSGASTHARVGMISRLDLGPAILTNVPVIVYRDADLVPRAAPSQSPGTIGFPVLQAIGRFGMTKDGHVAVSSPGVAPVDSTPRARIALDEASLNHLTPVIEGVYKGKRVSLLLTFDDTPTRFFYSFLRFFPAPPPPDTSSRKVVESGTPRILQDLDLEIGGRTVHLDSATALTESASAETVLHDGRLGRDALEKVDAVTFDLSTMTVGFANLPPPPVLPTLTYPDETTRVAEAPPGPRELVFIGLLFALFILPKALQRFRIPGAITSLFMGAAANVVGSFPNDPTVHLLSTLGIVALFLFAGLEIDGRELRKNSSALTFHAIIWAVLATVTAAAISLIFRAPPRMAALLALALVTPSTGFILSSLSTFGLTIAEQRTVKSYAVGSELLALTALFFVLQSTSLLRLVLAIAAMVGVVVLIPLAFRFFAKVVAPYAPRSEFAFLLMVAVVCAYTTRSLGVYYLVGAFLVGVAAQRFRADHPAMSSEKMVDALESFGSVFIPFYFFYAGTEIDHNQLTPRAFGLGLLMALVFVPLRVLVVGLQRRLTLGERFASARRIGSALVPTLVFTLVIVTILRDRFALSNELAGGLVLYTILNTLLPAFVLHGAPADFEDVEAAPVTVSQES